MAISIHLSNLNCSIFFLQYLISCQFLLAVPSHPPATCSRKSQPWHKDLISYFFFLWQAKSCKSYKSPTSTQRDHRHLSSWNIITCSGSRDRAARSECIEGIRQKPFIYKFKFFSSYLYVKIQWNGRIFIGGDYCITMWMYLIPLNCTLKMVTTVKKKTQIIY